MAGSEQQPEVTGGPALRRIVLLAEYDGTRYHGLQRQGHTPLTIQQEFESAVGRLGVTEPDFVASGRTDSGVHATGQAVALNVPAEPPVRKYLRTFNALLPADIRVRAVAECPEGFSPRFDARRRTYIYRVCALEPVPPLQRNFVAFAKTDLDVERTRAAAAAFEGRWELSAWRSAICQATRTLLTIDECTAVPPHRDERTGEALPWWTFRTAARSFLHHQVRLMAGAIVAVGSGRLGLEELRNALAAGERPKSVVMMPACGLCLARVEFDPERDPFR